MLICKGLPTSELSRKKKKIITTHLLVTGNLCFRTFMRRTWQLAIDDLRISHNASGMEANIRVLVT